MKVSIIRATLASVVLSAVCFGATLTKSFVPDRVAPGGTTALIFTITNTDATAATGLAFTDTLPAGLLVTTPNGLSNTCGGTVTAVAGSGSISLSGGSVSGPAGTICSISVNITATIEATEVNTTSTLTSATGAPTPAATATLLVASPPILTKSFGEVAILRGSSTALTFVLRNPNVTTTLTGLAFTDVLPAGLIVRDPNNLTGSCGAGTITAVAGSATISLTGATLAAGASCTFSVDVAGIISGSQTNTTGTVTSNQAPVGAAATAAIFVGDPFQVDYISNLDAGDSVVNITNSGTEGASLAFGTSASVTGSICANVYVFSLDEQLVECCSCPVTPDALVSLSAQRDLINNPLTRGGQTSVVIKLLATIPVGGTCLNSAAGVGTASLARGMAAWGTKLHLAPSAGAARQFALTENAFVPSDLSAGELSRLANTCGFVIAQGSGFGVCNSCRLGGLGAAIQP